MWTHSKNFIYLFNFIAVIIILVVIFVGCPTNKKQCYHLLCTVVLTSFDHVMTSKLNLKIKK